MKQPIQFTHGDEEITARQYDDGRLDCPRCPSYTTFDGVDPLRQHLSTQHNIMHRETRECKNPNCDESFNVAQYHDQEFCSNECAGETYGTGNNSCRLCGTFLSEDTDEHCEKCAKLVAIGDELESADKRVTDEYSAVGGD